MSARNAVAFEIEDEKHPDARKPGAFHFLRAYDDYGSVKKGERLGIAHACPCGCGGLTALWFRGKGPINADSWDVVGEWPKVTLTPSIGIKYDGNGNRQVNPYHWHGFLENGVFVER